MPSVQYREAELRIVLCAICMEPLTKKAIPNHRLKVHKIPKGGKLSDHYVENTEEKENEREFLKIKSIADINKYKDLGVQISTRGTTKTSSKWLNISEIIQNKDLKTALDRFLVNKQRPGGRSTPWSKKLGELYQRFVQLRIIAEEFFENEMENLQCPVCWEVIPNMESLRIFLRRENGSFDFCNNDPSSCHYLCTKCVKKSVKYPTHGKCYYNCCDQGVYL